MTASPDFQRLLELLKSEDAFFIATHINPDGDAIGSSVALSLALESIGKKTTVFDKDGVTRVLSFLPHSQRVTGNSTPSKAEVLILVDCNKPQRTGLEGAVFKRAAVIDHHETESDFGDIRWVEPHRAACGLMVLDIIKALGVRLTQDIAVNLYSAISIDTGAFRFPNTDADTLDAASQLVRAGAKPGEISDKLYQNWTENRFRLFCMFLNTIETIGDICVSCVDMEMMQKTGTTSEDTEFFVNQPLVISSISISAFFRETEKDVWKASLRSKGDYNVAAISALYEGGGHRNAAGFTIRGDFQSIRASVLGAIEKSLT